MASPSFQIDDETLEEFDQLINIKKATGDLPSDANRSEVLRNLVEEYIEGNGNSLTSSVEVMIAD
jgi:metal-responsive CopG/Arc/MetJ family transcriptional regulator